ncbi:MAG: alpha/beta fold hydrolase [Actinobacteria bacterium]|nr:alpha/beta fold hydrolase [Actinomycetota bacterium]MBU2688665.1 alpha/beta fold hydrolase [Actinomycetota bacterium]
MDFKRAYQAAALLPVLRGIRNDRRPPPGPHCNMYVGGTDGVELFCTVLGSDPRRAVVVAHPAVVGSSHSQVVALAEELSRSFTVITFDFRGHGRSTGRCPLGFGKVSEDLEAVLARVRRMGFEKVAVSGFSLGAAAAFVAGARGVPFDALVSIGCPPVFPEIAPWAAGHPRLVRSGLRLMGMRADASPDGGPTPLDVAPDVPPVPKILYFGEWEVCPPEQIDVFVQRVRRPVEVVTVAGAWHADLAGREPKVREWLERRLTPRMLGTGTDPRT